MLAPKYSAEIIAALERRGVKLGQFVREIVEDLAGVLDALEDELVDCGNRPSVIQHQLGQAIAEVLAAAATPAPATLPGSLCGPGCWACKNRMGGIHLAPLADAGGGGQ